MGLTQRVLDLCRERGFALAGIARPQPSNRVSELRDWIAAGKHGEMAYLEHHTDIRAEPARILPGARSVICVADRYHAGSRDRARYGTGRIARYARGDDYHRVMKKRLHDLCDALGGEYPDHAFRTCVDTAPIQEREIAVSAGLGQIGKHTLLIEPGVGSWLLLGEVFTTLCLDSANSESRDICGTCTRCIDACPTNAITPYEVDATKCISYLTIEHRSQIDERFHQQIGDWIFGCDICQEVCPHCQPTRRAKRAVVHPAYESRRDQFDLLEILGWSEQDRRDAFMRSALKRAKLVMMKRNAIIASANWLSQRHDPALCHRIKEIAADEQEDALVRETANAVLKRLNA